MFLLTIYTDEDGTFEVKEPDHQLSRYKSGSVVSIGFYDQDGSLREYHIRPYYRKKYKGTVNIFCEQELEITGGEDADTTIVQDSRDGAGISDRTATKRAHTAGRATRS